jgi:hypothetical protein
VLGYGEPPLFIGTLGLHGNLYLWHVLVVIYENSTTDHIHRRQVVEASTPRWTFKGGMRDATQEDLAILRYEEEDQMDHSQYRHFPSRAQEGAEVVVMPVGDRDCIGCFTDQVKLTCATSVNDFSWKSCKNT